MDIWKTIKLGTLYVIVLIRRTYRINCDDDYVLAMFVFIYCKWSFSTHWLFNIDQISGHSPPVEQESTKAL